MDTIPEASHQFYAEAIIGWRTWHLVSESRNTLSPYALSSMISSSEWPPYKLMEAKCDPVLALASLDGGNPYIPHTSPGWDCTCGIYAYKDRDLAGKHIPETACAFGAVALQGSEVIECDYGYRAQSAYPQYLYWLPIERSARADTYIAAALADTYGVPCEVVYGCRGTWPTRWPY